LAFTGCLITVVQFSLFFLLVFILFFSIMTLGFSGCWFLEAGENYEADGLCEGVVGL
jgi:hypothetical protein